MREPESSSPPDALMLLGTHCPHCPAVLQALSELVKSGELGSLKAVNIDQRPDVARELGVRSVPWVRIGPFELAGSRSKGEFSQWIERVVGPEGMAAYFNELLSEGKVDRVLQLLQQNNGYADALLMLLGEPDTRLNVRIGIGALMEDLEGSALLQSMVPGLGELTRAGDAGIRGDACHYLGLSRSGQARPFVQGLSNDASDEVREVAQDSLRLLDEVGN